MRRKLTICGGGNGALAMAADLTLAGHCVTLYEMPQFQSNIEEVFATHKLRIVGKGRQGIADIPLVTSDIEEALKEPDLVLIVAPVFAHAPYANMCAPYLRDGHKIVLVPGTMGSLEFVEILRQKRVDANVLVGELCTLPYAARRTGPNQVSIYNTSQDMVLGVFPGQETASLLDIVCQLYPVTRPAASVLEAGLYRTNPIIHPVGVMLNAGHIERAHGEFYLYEEAMTPSVVRVLEACDKERMSIGKALGIQLPSMAGLLHKEGYGPKGDLWEVLNGSRGLTPLKGPAQLETRYITEDVPYGLVTWASLGNLVGVPVPLMSALVDVASALMDTDYWQEGRTASTCGIEGMDAQELRDFVILGERC
jgi:opine dehydrogenase